MSDSLYRDGEDETKTWGTSEIVCPWCGDEWSDSWEAGDSDTETCFECAKRYTWSRNIEVTYTSERLPDKEPANGLL